MLTFLIDFLIHLYTTNSIVDVCWVLFCICICLIFQSILIIPFQILYPCLPILFSFHCLLVLCFSCCLILKIYFLSLTQATLSLFNKLFYLVSWHTYLIYCFCYMFCLFVVLPLSLLFLYIFLFFIHPLLLVYDHPRALLYFFLSPSILFLKFAESTIPWKNDSSITLYFL